jgi:tagatose-6-phosphate ketose/aldose isomerase
MSEAMSISHATESAPTPSPTPSGPPAAMRLGALAARPEAERRRLGCADTLQEILQQPETWVETGQLAIEARAEIAACLAGAGVGAGAGTVVLTGSGSSAYVGDCLAPGLEAALGCPVLAVPAGDLVTHPERRLPRGGPLVLASIARSGQSPESLAAVEWLCRRRPDTRHVVLTCNRGGALARLPGAAHVVLADRTNDRSLVMTSSFTNLLVAGRVIAHLGTGEDGAAAGARYRTRVAAAAAAARALVDRHADAIGAIAARGVRRAIQLGTGPHLGAAREASLKLIEMTAGHALSLAETFLGLRHGPLAALEPGTLLVAYLSSAPRARAHEIDVLLDVRRKRTGAFALVVGEQLPAALAGEDACLLECPGRDGLGDDDAVLLDVVVGQLLAFFACLRLGLEPDDPSPRGLISRVVEPFPIHDGPGGDP